MVKAVIFDLDDTLYNELDYVLQGFRNVAEYLGKEYSVDVDEVHERMCKILREQGRGKIFDSICEAYHITAPVKKLVEIYRATKPKLFLYPDAEEVLNKLRQKNMKIGLITDGCSQVQHQKIDALYLNDLMDAVLATDDLGKDEEGNPYCKPNKRVYEFVLEKLQCKPQDAIYIGDNPQKDFVGAKALGMKTLRIVREMGDHMHEQVESEYEADVTIHNLTECMGFL
ncbi:MAG: HAD family hydrolase [Lachnospiraceae bacterium]|nr:HAD family hydrolase [Lachnospiraceae bacterium]